MKIKSIASAILAVCLMATSVFFFGECGKSEKKNQYYADSFSTITWPDSVLAKLLPVPESTSGLIDTDRADWLNVYIGDTTQEQYESYVKSCKEKGFTENYDNGTTYDNCPYYRAENSDGYRLALEYHKEDKDTGFRPLKNTMTIELQTPYVEETVAETEKATEKPTQAPTKASQNSENTQESKSNMDNGTVTPSFKEMMDSYEAFFDEYIAFMKKYKGNPSDLSLLSEYSDYISKYSDYLSKLNSVDTGNLSTADLAYYTEVNNRILKKLADVGY